MTELRSNRVKSKLAGGDVATVVMGCVNPDIVELLGQFDFDGIWIEAEHGPVDFRDIGDLTRACDLWGKTSVVRVNLNLPGMIYRTLDQGAQAIAVPHVNTAQEARAVVEAAKFYPLGSRGSYTGRQGIGVRDYFTKANSETMVVVLLEDVIAIDNLDEILSVDNVDVFFVPPGDLAQSMGYPGQPTHPSVVDTVHSAIKQIIKAGKVAGALANDANLESQIASGARFIAVNSHDWLRVGAMEYLERVASITR